MDGQFSNQTGSIDDSVKRTSSFKSDLKMGERDDNRTIIPMDRIFRMEEIFFIEQLGDDLLMFGKAGDKSCIGIIFSNDIPVPVRKVSGKRTV